MRRKNEFSDLYNRELMERCPPGVDAQQWQAFREKYNRASQLARLDAPAQLDLELNSQCNLRCPFCIQSQRDMGRDSLPDETWQKVLREAYALGVRSLKLNYQNEPLLNKDLEYAIAYARKLGFLNVFLSTNGILLSEDRAQGLIDAGLTKLFVSIDAATAETYEQQRDSRLFSRVVSNVRRFVAIRDSMNLSYPLLRVNFLVTTINAHEKELFTEQWQDVADMIIFQDMNETMANEASGLMPNRSKTGIVFRCSFPFKQLVVTAKGDLLPCCPQNGINHKLGNLQTMSLAEAWQSGRIEYLRTLHAEGRYADDPACLNCVRGK